MKKMFFLGALFAVGLGFTACSSDKDDVAESNFLDKFDANGQAYISLGINLPTTSGATRAANDDYDDGTEAEYAVVNANSLFIIFSGDNESNATVKSAYTLNPSTDWAMDGNTAITKKAITQAIKKDGIDASDNIYALVVLNAQSLLSADTDNKLKDGSSNDLSNKTLAEVNTAITASLTTANLNATNFIMTNAPMTNRASGGATPSTALCSTLSLIDKSKIFATSTEAEAAPAANVYVERMAAKITVNGTASGNLTTDNTVGYTIKGWVLDNLNPSSNLTRVFDVAWIDYRSVNIAGDAYMPYRFTSLTEIEAGAGLYRTYWATSKSNSLSGKTPTTPFTAETPTALALNTSTYCCENTTTVANMTEENSTRIVVGVQFNGGNPFYTISLQGTDEMYTETTAKTYVQGYLAGQTAVKDWFTTYFDGTAELADVITKCSVTLGANATDASKIDNISATMTGADLSSYTFKGSYDADAAIAAFNALSVVTGLSSAFTMKYYNGGLAYYPIFIEHFGDTYTPWPDTEGTTTNVVYVNSTYDSGITAEERYLGRWGVVRNNWYIITVSGISHIGEPNIPNLTTTPLDQSKSYLSLKIAVTPWAKRIQDVVL